MDPGMELIFPGRDIESCFGAVLAGEDAQVVEVGRQFVDGVVLEACFGEAMVKAKCKKGRHEGIAVFPPLSLRHLVLVVPLVGPPEHRRAGVI